MLGLLLVGLCLSADPIQSSDQSLNSNFPSVVKSLTEVEAAFAKKAAADGISPAFLEFLADDGLLFRPLPVNGKQVHRDKPAPSGQRLTWHPTFVVAAGSGKLGFTTGPYEFRTSPQAKPATGHYITIWKMTPAGWRAEVDLGIPHPPSANPSQPYTWLPTLESQLVAAGTAKASKTEARQSLFQLEKQFAQSAATEREAYHSLAHDHLRWYRPGKVPVIDQAVVNEWSKTEKPPIWRPKEVIVDESRDFAYSYGEGEQMRDGKTVRFSYLHIYRGGERWKLLLDIALPI